MKKIFLALAAIAAVSVFSATAQEQPSSPEDQEKKLLEYIDKEVERLSSILDLEYWQEFYVDSTLNNNLHAMQKELMELQAAKVTNADMYSAAQDRWMESTYNAFNKFLTPEQWEKYLKNGAAREKKARDKRAQKAAKASEKLRK
ncbi:MAG: hypothetical protein IJM35_07815 [Bacteroidales bacterium]|nr:hypothetical protein [Bacteroidales bacterium]